MDVVDETRKRQRKECLQIIKEQNKQVKDNIPKIASSSINCTRPTTTTCVIDPITASLTSTSLYYEQLAKGVKRKAESKYDKLRKCLINKTLGLIRTSIFSK